MIVIDQSKLDRQEKGASIWAEHKGRGTLNYVPRFGKTNTAMLIINKIREKHITDEILIVVPSQIVKSQWDKIVEESGHLMINVYTIDALMEATNKVEFKPYLFIIDEIHKFTSERRYGIFKLIHYKFILGLTGTYPVGREAALLNQVCPIVDTITEKEALENNWVSKFIEYNLKLELSPEDKDKYAKFSEPIKEILECFRNAHKLFPEGLFKDHYDLVQSCYSGKKVMQASDGVSKYAYIKASVIRTTLAEKKGWNHDLNLSNEYNRMIEDNWNPDVIKEHAEMFNDYVRKRNDILTYNKVKLNAVIELFKRFPVTTICFNESTDFSDLISNAINEITVATHNKVMAASYHSNIKSQPMKDADGNIITYKSGDKKGQPKLFGIKSIRNAIIENIKNKNLLFLSTARALDEGLDIPNIEFVITTAGTTNPIQYTQRNARGKTVDIYNPDKVTTIVNLYFDNFILDGKQVNSRDLSKLQYRQEKAHTKPIYISSIDEIM